ncbi:carbohydrate ABC transporter substrate-binding protein, CUT1 family, partial [gut metagenome]
MDKSEPPTLFVIGNQAAVKTWGDYAIDLTGTKIAAEGNTDDFNLYGADGKFVSQGYCYECFGVIANPDLISKAGHDINQIHQFSD